MRIMFAGGGTGGHVYPALAVMKKLRETGEEGDIMFVGTSSGLESSVISRYSWIDFFTIDVSGINRSRPLTALKAFCLLPLSLVQSLRLIVEKQPQVIYVTGGYSSFPVGVIAAILSIPLVIHEFNAQPGLTNRLLAPVADVVLVSQAQASSRLRADNVESIATPVRPVIFHNYSNASIDFGLSPDKPTVLVFGGSGGARVLTEKVLEALNQAAEQPDYQFILQTGSVTLTKKSNELVSKLPNPDQVFVTKYIESMGKAYDASDLVICRGGASTLAELRATRKPALIIPWSQSSASHQKKNARSLEKKGLVECLSEPEWRNLPLFNKLDDLVKKYSSIENEIQYFSSLPGRQHAAEQVVDYLMSFQIKGAG